MTTPPTDGLRAYYGADGRLYYRSFDPFVDGQAVGGICPPWLAIEAPSVVSNQQAQTAPKSRLCRAWQYFWKPQLSWGQLVVTMAVLQMLIWVLS
jgi:hypothetical protein